MMDSVPRRHLGLLVCLVLLLHLALLLAWPQHPVVPQDAPALVFSTRMLEPEPPVVAPPAAAPQPAAAPVARSKPKPRRHIPPPKEVEAEPEEPLPASSNTPKAGIDPDIGMLPPVAPETATSAVAPAGASEAETAPASPGTPASEPELETDAASVRVPHASPTPTVEAAPVRLPASTTLEFDVSGKAKGFQYSASAELRWHQEGEQYQARQKVSAFFLGSRVQSSTGRITAQGLEPERFVDQARRERTAQFDFAAHEVRFSGNPQPAALAPGAQDRLSLFIQLGAMLAAAPERYPVGTRITMTTVSARSVDEWVFAVEGAEELDLPAGKTPALKLQRLPRPGRNNEQKAELWLGTQLAYLPVRIRLSEANGDYADLLLSGHTNP